jgi:hypothetical protein
MVNIIATFENAEYGIKSYVTKGAKGFHVSVQDTDTTEFLDLVTIYPTEERAIAAAQKAAR